MEFQQVLVLLAFLDQLNSLTLLHRYSKEHEEYDQQLPFYLFLQDNVTAGPENIYFIL